MEHVRKHSLLWEGPLDEVPRRDVKIFMRVEPNPPVAHWRYGVISLESIPKSVAKFETQSHYHQEDPSRRAGWKKFVRSKKGEGIVCF